MSRISIHAAPDKEAIERNKKREPLGEQIRAELIDWINRNGIVTVMLDTDEHCISVDIVKLPPEIKPALTLWGSIYVRNEPEFTSPKEPAKSKPEDVQLDVELEKRIAEIRERESKATKGPWTVRLDTCKTCHENGKEGEYDILQVPSGYHAMLDLKEDAEFIAHARADIPFLLEQLALLRRVPGKGAGIEVRVVCPERAPDMHTVFVNGKEVMHFEYEHDAHELAATLRAALTTQGTPEGL